MENNIVYGFAHNPCLWESASRIISLHRSRKGAEDALIYHKDEVYQEYLEMLDYQLEEYVERNDYSSVYSFSDWVNDQAWLVEEMEIED